MIKLRQDVVGDASWVALFDKVASRTPADVVSFLEKALGRYSSAEPSFYNDDDALGRAVDGAVLVARAVASWKSSIEMLASAMGMDLQVRVGPPPALSSGPWRACTVP